MQTTPKYINIVPGLIGSLTTRSFMFVCICAVFPLTPYGDPAVGVIQGDVFMSWGINTTDITFTGVVLNPNGATLIVFSPISAKFTVTPAFSNRVKDNGSSIYLSRISFHLLNLTVTDFGRYYYRVSDTDGTDVGGQVLVIAGNPANISVMEVSDPFEDEMYTIRCSAQSTSVPLGMGLTMHYQWKRENGQIITVSDRYSFSSDQSTLTINPLKRQDAGNFVCEAWEHVGAVSKSAPFSLKVNYGPDPGSIQLSPNRTSHELTESSSLTVNCSADCFPDCQYKWTGPGGNIVSSTDLLSFISIGRNQSGQYTCTALNSRTPIKSATATIRVTVLYGPDDRKVSLFPSITSYQLTELSRLDVNCSATCEPQCNYQWSGPGLVSQNNNMGWLSISQIQRNQNGTFICTVTNPKVPGKSATANFSVIVYYGPDTNGLTLLPSNKSYQLTESSPFTVQCTATCVPQCNYQWMGPGISQNDNQGLLSVSEISRNQSGTFICTVTNPKNPGKSVTANLSVIVYYGPDDKNVSLSPSNTSYQLTELSRLDVKCSATCVPQCNYQWFGPGLVSQNDNMGWLNISQIQRNQNGTFICTVTNPKVPGKSATANFSVIVYYGPDFNGINFSPSSTSYQLIELSSLHVQCTANCIPQCNYQWMGPGISQNDSNGLLSVSRISRNQAGTFACTVTNPRMPGKSVTANFSLIVFYPPVLTMKASNTSKGGRVVINCTASGVPDNYTFYKLTHKAPDESRTIVRELELTRVSNSDVSFTIEGVTYQDTGFYVCKVSNGIAHYSSGQLVMEDMVYIWITDQPVITSNTKDFDTDKGRSGQMYIEFYPGLSQPLVTWYIDKNGTMEQLRNSSNFGIYLSTVIVDVNYYQRTVRLPGYNASLEVFSVDQEHFTSYMVEINDSFAHPVFETLELKPRGPPETPYNLSVVPDSVTTHSLQLTWRAGFHGGASQTFVIEYREVGNTDWLTKEEPGGLVQYITLNTTIPDLKDGTRHEFRIYSKNVYDRSQISSVINTTTKIVPSTYYESPESSVAGIAGGISAGLVIILVIVIVLVLWKRNKHKKQDTDNDVTREHGERRSSPIKANCVKQDVATGSDYEGLHFIEAEANQYLQLNDITLEEDRNINIRSPESDSYEKLQPYANSDIQMYSSLKIPKISKDSVNYENTWIKGPVTKDEIQNKFRRF